MPISERGCIPCNWDRGHDQQKTTADEIAALKKKVEELEAKVSPPKSDFVPMSDAEWRDQMHQAAEKRMSMATPPSVVRDWAVLDDRLVKEIAMRDARAPTSPRGTIPSQQVTGGGGPLPSPTPGWSEPRPLTNPPGTNWVDAVAIVDDIRQRSKDKR
jgi:hypothetical protein